MLRLASVAAVFVGALLGSSLAATTVDSTILIIARSDEDVDKVRTGLDGYGIPWDKAIIPHAGAALPPLNTSLTQGRYGGILVIGSVSYDNGGGLFQSALTDQQWDQMYAYQTAFNVRMVRFDEYPGPDFGAATAVASTGCCANNQEQRISISDASQFPGANIKTNAPMSTVGLWHYPANITDTANTTAFATFEPSGAFAGTTVAAVINKHGGRQQMVWFMDWANDWSATCAYLQHAYIHWVTRSVFVGKRKIHLSTQVDDVHLNTDLYRPVGTSFKLRTGDLDAHVTWQRSLNSRLPAGSSFWLELGHNGNGDIEGAVTKPLASLLCNPKTAVEYDSPLDTPLEFVKVPGTGVDLWPASFTQYSWSSMCATLDELAAWFTNPFNLNAYAHVSHTFSHEELNNATYHDASREISFNQAWLKQLRIDTAQRFSANGIIPPAITGLHNADALKAWTDNGIKYVVGDNTRPVLRNQQSKYWPLATTVATNGREGIWIIPRFATTIYYNCDKPDCTLQEWKDTSAGSGDFANLLLNARQTNTRYLLDLQADPYMFHQANMRQTDMPTSTVGTQTGKMSLIMTWVETITQEMTRLTNWPMTSLKHDDIAKYFLDRMTLDGCQPKASYSYAADGKSIESVVVTAKGNSCSVPVPVTIPTGTVTASAGTPMTDKVGSEPPIIWVAMSGSPVTLRLASPVKF